jgi:hypothetical protein
VTDDTRARFLTAIAERVGADLIEEAHLFPAIRQGGTESAVAVIAVRVPPADDGSGTPPHGDPLESHAASGQPGTDHPVEDDRPEVPPDHAEDDPSDLPPHGDALVAVRERSARLTVYTAKYRLTLKGPERGKWVFAVQAEADAPLVTVETVVRGVRRRSGDVEDPARLSGDEFRALLSGSPA